MMSGDYGIALKPEILLAENMIKGGHIGHTITLV